MSTQRATKCVLGFAILFTVHTISAFRVHHISPSIGPPKGRLSSITIVEDQPRESIPESHRGLHDFLYGQNEDHGASRTASKLPIFSKDVRLPITDFLQRFKPASSGSIPAVYGVYDSRQELQYVGISRNVGVSLASHLQAKGPTTVAYVAMQTFAYPKRDEMAACQQHWLDELGSLPPGNQGLGWAETIKEAMQYRGDAAQQARYEEIKVKLRTAMADPTLQDELDDLNEAEEDDGDANESAAIRREQLRRAMQDSDWSGVIDAQTKETRMSVSPVGTIRSPFAGTDPAAAAASASQLSQDGDQLELTSANVDKVLDEVRPYLISDGGNIELVHIDMEPRNILLRLQGACGSCPSSTTTMKMGVERVLREKFPNLGVIEATSEQILGTDGMPMSGTALLRKNVEEKIAEIMPAVRGLGATANIENVSDSGVVTLLFRGPDKVKLGIVYALKAMQGVSDVRTI